MGIIQVLTNGEGQYLAIVENGENFAVGSIVRENGLTSFGYTRQSEHNGNLEDTFKGFSLIEYSQCEVIASLPLPQTPIVPQTMPTLESWGGDLGKLVTAVLLWVNDKINKPTNKQ